ncbi:MAG: type II toxin-antitoxin system RelE/ParE family toxin [Dongiaceae bacterium]
MPKHRLSRAAAADLDDIFLYTIKTFGLRQAERYYLAIQDSLQRIAETPDLGRAIAGRTRAFRQFNCQRHGIFYTVGTDGISVVRILHLAMDLKAHLPQ